MPSVVPSGSVPELRCRPPCKASVRTDAGRWAEREPSEREREAFAGLAAHYCLRQLEQVAKLSERLGEGPSLQRARRRLAAGEPLSPTSCAGFRPKPSEITRRAQGKRGVAGHTSSAATPRPSASPRSRASPAAFAAARPTSSPRSTAACFASARAARRSPTRAPRRTWAGRAPAAPPVSATSAARAALSPSRRSTREGAEGARGGSRFAAIGRASGHVPAARPQGQRMATGRALSAATRPDRAPTTSAPRSSASDGRVWFAARTSATPQLALPFASSTATSSQAADLTSPPRRGVLVDPRRRARIDEGRHLHPHLNRRAPQPYSLEAQASASPPTPSRRRAGG